MLHKFKGFRMDVGNGIWVEFDRSYRNDAGRRYYKFNCHIEPIFCVSDNEISLMKYKDPTYVISEFTVRADKSGKRIHSVRLGNQNHPHKDPRNGLLCIGAFKGEVLNPATIKKLVICCLLKYMEMDCYCVPDIRIAEKIMVKETEGNRCLIS